MKIFKNVSHYLICAAVAFAVIITVIFLSGKIFPSNYIFRPEISDTDSADAPSVYPWYNVKNGRVTEIPTENQEKYIIQIVSFLSLNTAEYLGTEKFMYGEADNMYYAENVTVAAKDVELKANVAYHFDGGKCNICYVELKTPKASSKEKLAEAMKKYRTYLNEDMLLNSSYDAKYNPFIRFFEYLRELFNRKGYYNNEIALVSEIDFYRLLTEAVDAESYIYDGLVWFTCGSSETPFVFAVDPDKDDTVILFSAHN